MSKKRSGKNPSNPESKQDHSPIVYQRDKISKELKIRELPWTPKQLELLNLISDKNSKMIFVSGPAGVSKSICSVYGALKALNERKMSHIIYCRPILESADMGSRLGYLPGDKKSKEAPYKRVVEEKMEELLSKEDVDYLTKEERVEFAEVNFMRGASLNAVFLIIDEVQSFTYAEIITLITRVGKYSKVILCADPAQSDLPEGKRGAFNRLKELFDDEESRTHGIFNFEFTADDVMRSGLCKYIVQKTSQQKAPPEVWSPRR